jgi:hypothetical protein
MSFFKTRDQEDKTGPVWAGEGGGTNGRREDIRKGYRRVNMVEIYTHV